MPCPLVVGADVGATWIRLVARRGQRRVGALRTPATEVGDVGTFLPSAFRVRGWRGVAALVVIVLVILLAVFAPLLRLTCL